MVTISVVTPTIGRDSLRATAASLVPQLHRGDEWILVSDGPDDLARAVARKARTLTAARVVLAEAKDATSQFGNAQRDMGIQLAKGSHLCFLDDDDVWNPGAGDAFREATGQAPDRVHVFKARWGDGHHWHGVLWREPILMQGNIGTPMVCIPNRVGLPRWMSYNERGIVSDFGWLHAAVAGLKVAWHCRIVATVRPEKHQ